MIPNLQPDAWPIDKYSARDALDDLMNALDRKTGSRTFTIERQSEFDVAIIALCDALDRNF